MSLQENKKNPQIILGIDPGTRITGYGVVLIDGNNIKTLDYGCIRPPKDSELGKRYQIIFRSVMAICEKFSPTAISVETQFMYKNAQSAMKLGMARGMVLLAAAENNIPVFEYAPKKAKMSVTGQGSASKEDVQRMIQLLLELPKPPEPEDAADALALAICHSQQFQRSRLHGL